MMKCKLCNIEKPLNEYHKCKLCKDGVRLVCKSCVKKDKKKYDKIYHEKNKINKNKNSKIYYQKNKLKHNENCKNYKIKNKLILSEKKKIYDKNNLENKKQYMVNRRKNDVLFRLTGNYKTMLGYSIRKKGYLKNSKSELILGCSFEVFKQHLESKFESWMNWDNYGNPKDGIFEPNKTWDIDHIIPLSRAKTEEELLKLNHYTNLQPLCSYHNRFIKKNNYGL
ncbi:MAG: HNH endonuclease [Spirochaetes bacterium]|nr:MAG: HNH endonuclease [Spirochaetota bacterium]